MTGNNDCSWSTGTTGSSGFGRVNKNLYKNREGIFTKDEYEVRRDRERQRSGI